MAIAGGVLPRLWDRRRESPSRVCGGTLREQVRELHCMAAPSLGEHSSEGCSSVAAIRVFSRLPVNRRASKGWQGSRRESKEKVVRRLALEGLPLVSARWSGDRACTVEPRGQEAG